MRQVLVDKIEKSAHRKATALCLLGATIPIAQFAFIGYGSFEYASWDIFEPINYLMTLGNFTFGFFMYIWLKKDLDLTNIH